MARRKILSVSLDIILPALCRDDRKRMPPPGLARSAWQPPFITCDGMPDDARVIDIRPNPAFDGMLDLLVESDTFPDVPSGCCLDRMYPTMTTYTSYQTYLEMTDRGEAKPPEAPADESQPRGGFF